MNGNSAGPARTRSVGVLATIGSVLAAMFGVQSSRIRRRDLAHGNPLLFIAVGIAMSGVLVLTLTAIVRALVPNASS